MCFIDYAQAPEDVLQSAWFIPNSTARSLSVGGAVGALGGDISSAYNNPAGLGMYKTREIVITPSFLFNNNKADYRGTASSKINKTAFQLGTVGVVVGGRLNQSNNSTAFSISINQLASYDNKIHYAGLNNYSSYSEQYLEELTNAHADTNAALNDYPFGSSLAFLTYLIDSLADPQGNLVGYKSFVPVQTGIKQDYDETTKGGLYEISAGFASNNRDKLYLGASINIPLSFYTQDIDYTETDASANTNNNFSFSQFNQHHKINGAGINARLGLIYRAANSLRLGFAVHTPSLMQITDDLNVAITTNTENYAGLQTAKSSDFPNAATETRYNEITPYRLIASASYILNEVENVKMQKGFITADVEYVNYRGARFHEDNNDETGQGSSSDYFDALNNAIKSYYKGGFNFRLGGELKFSPLAIRLGGAYYGSPYKDNSLKANRILAAGGLGYRNRGIFVDVTLAEMFNKDVSFPYRLTDKANTYAQLKNQRMNLLVTVGVKF